MKARSSLRIPTRLLLAVSVIAVGAALGVGLFTFIYAKGASYLTDDPAACANCHAMYAHYDAWHKSSHHAVAVCNDCHTPDGFVAKYVTKGINGFNHSWKFTTGDYPEHLRANWMNRRITRDACAKCHGDIVDALNHGGLAKAGEAECVQCHGEVGHAL